MNLKMFASDEQHNPSILRAVGSLYKGINNVRSHSLQPCLLNCFNVALDPSKTLSYDLNLELFSVMESVGCSVQTRPAVVRADSVCRLLCTQPQDLKINT